MVLGCVGLLKCIKMLVDNATCHRIASIYTIFHIPGVRKLATLQKDTFARPHGFWTNFEILAIVLVGQAELLKCIKMLVDDARMPLSCLLWLWSVIDYLVLAIPKGWANWPPFGSRIYMFILTFWFFEQDLKFWPMVLPKPACWNASRCLLMMLACHLVVYFDRDLS